MNKEQAITAFDDHLVFLAKRGMINNGMLRKLSGALEVLAESDSDSGIEEVAQINAHNQKLLILKTVIKSCGITEKGMAVLHNLNDSFLEVWMEACRKGLAPRPVTEQAFDLMVLTERQVHLLAQTDVKNINTYVFFKNLELKYKKKKIPLYSPQFKAMFPRLEDWFNTIDEKGFFDQKKAYDHFYNHHLNSWN